MSNIVLSNDNIKKLRSPSLLLQGLTAAQIRLSENHPMLPTLMAKHSSIQAGIGGEERVEYEFSKHSFPLDHYIFYDLSLTSASTFQMDTFFLTRYYGIIFEVKNISGTLQFIDNPPQLIQTKDNGEVKGLESPAAQVERNGDLLTIWLNSRNIDLPIYRVVVLAYPKQIVEKAPAKTKILFPSLIPSYIRNIPQNHVKLDLETFNWLSSELVNNHIFYIPSPICETYNIPKTNILTGVICDSCGYIGMKKTNKSWYCSNCESFNPLAHHQTIKEWFLLFGGKMTNKDCREFLHVDRYTATRILKNMNLKSEGANKNRSYWMDFEELFRNGLLT